VSGREKEVKFKVEENFNCKTISFLVCLQPCSVAVFQETVHNVKINLFDPYYQLSIKLIRVLLMKNKIIQFGRISNQKNKRN